MVGPVPGTSRLLRTGMGAAAVGLLLIYNSVDTRSAEGSSSAAAAPPAAIAPAVPVPSVPPSAAAGPDPAAAAGLPALPPSKPTRLRIPQIAVDAPFTELTLDPTGQLNAPPPDDKNLVGWYQDSATPGELGNAVVAGHLDTMTGPAVFLKLNRLTPGNKVEVSRADGTVAVFSVDSVQTYAKSSFPDQKVYGETPDAQLRLITCGGVYDRQQHGYLDNVVVFAHLESSHQA